MTEIIVHSREIVTLLGAAAVPEAVLRESLALGPRLVAADGGAVRALQSGLMPEAVIGDFDSLAPDLAARIPPERRHHVDEQQSTDFDKALRHIAAPLVLAVGFTGQRLDHELAVYNALVRQAPRRAVVIGESDICFHLPGRLELALQPGTRLSLFPLAAMRCASNGLHWPTRGIDFAPWGRIGTSNEAYSDRVLLHPDGPGMLVILPRAQLMPVIAALRC
ncbi:MAG: thiamine diphosphokinase [Rhodobacteraceae bacterium]|nr:thiamine diphosphokinase [Paracoccaceae bacterium]